MAKKIHRRDSHIEMIEDKIIVWAKGQKEIRAVIEIGSQARSDHPADKWSDIDLVFVINQPLELTTQQEWINEVTNVLEDVWMVHNDRVGTQQTDWFPFVTIVSARQKVDIVLLTISSKLSTIDSLTEIIANSPFPYVFSPGMRILWDSQGYPPNPPLIKSGDYVVKVPSDGDFSKHVTSFWLHALQVGKLTARGELWRAEHIFYCSLHQELLIFIEWHAELLSKSRNKIWPRGRFLEEWADRRVFDSLFNHNLVNGFPDLWHSLKNTCNMFEILAKEIASELGFEFSVEQQERALSWMLDMENPA